MSGVLVGVTALAAAPRAWAVGDEELRVGAEVGYAERDDGEGAAGTVDLAWGLDDAFAVRVAVGDAVRGSTHVGALTLGGVYAIDVLRLVPFVEAGASLQARWGEQARRDLAYEVAGGVEYLVTRRWSLAGVIRFRGALVRLGGAEEDRPWLLTLGARLGWVF